MSLIKYIQKHKTPTCFGTEVPSSGGYSEKRSTRPTASQGIVSAFFKWLKYLQYFATLEHWNIRKCDRNRLLLQDAPRWQTSASALQLEAGEVRIGLLRNKLSSDDYTLVMVTRELLMAVRSMPCTDGYSVWQQSWFYDQASSLTIQIALNIRTILTRLNH